MTDEKLTKDLADFKRSLEYEINRHSLERMCNTPDYILTEYLMRCLSNFAIAHNDCLASRLKDVREAK